ncbi:hypothetical protein ACSBPQ_14845 [Stenotrophomonas sp. JC08]|uniref:hypothetical protein n=1 Tax=Stenotrophomonas sp. JC08 TaxID=3445779 RepID=UPI003FA33093
MSTINKDPLATVFVPEIEVRMLLHMLVKRVARPSILPMRCDAMLRGMDIQLGQWADLAQG